MSTQETNLGQELLTAGPGWLSSLRVRRASQCMETAILEAVQGRGGYFAGLDCCVKSGWVYILIMWCFWRGKGAMEAHWDGLGRDNYGIPAIPKESGGYNRCNKLWQDIRPSKAGEGSSHTRCTRTSSQVRARSDDQYLFGRLPPSLLNLSSALKMCKIADGGLSPGICAASSFHLDLVQSSIPAAEKIPWISVGVSPS